MTNCYNGCLFFSVETIADEHITGFAAKLRGDVVEAKIEEEEEEEPKPFPSDVDVVEETLPEEETSVREESIGEEEQKGDTIMLLFTLLFVF